jgi:uncharacterized protein YabE (DUF348 family)
MRKYLAPIIIVIVFVLITLVFLIRKTVTVTVDGRQIQFITYKSTVKQALEDNNIYIGSKDKIVPSLESNLTDRENITLKRAVSIKVKVDGKNLNIQSAEENIAEMLNKESITIKSEDRVTPAKETPLFKDMEVEIVRVETKIITEVIPVNYQEILKKDNKQPNTKIQILQEGRGGEKLIITSIVYENGKEVSKKIINETIIKEPVDKIIKQGGYPLLPVSRSGDIMAYSRVFKAKATAYWAVRGVGSTYTASGRKAIWDPDGYSTIAVDANVIPYGTKLFIEGYGFAIAADTGTAIIGNTIDVYFNTYNEACNWGLKYVNVYILK